MMFSHLRQKTPSVRVYLFLLYHIFRYLKSFFGKMFQKVCLFQRFGYDRSEENRTFCGICVKENFQVANSARRRHSVAEQFQFSVCRKRIVCISQVSRLKKHLLWRQKMSFKEYCSKNLENIICFGAAGAMVLIGIIAFVCIYCSK